MLGRIKGSILDSTLFKKWFNVRNNENIEEYENLKTYWEALVNFCKSNLLFYILQKIIRNNLVICLIDETFHQSQKNQKKSMHIYAKIVCALVNRFIKIIFQGKSLLIRETLHEHSMEEYLRKNSMCNSSKLSFSKKTYWYSKLCIRIQWKNWCSFYAFCCSKNLDRKLRLLCADVL